MIITVATVMFFCAIYGESTDWKEKNLGAVTFSEPDSEIFKQKCLDPQDEFCRNRQDLNNNFVGHFLRKKASSYGFPEIPTNTKVIPVFQSFYQCPCSCKMEYPLMDLGRKYFPRYLQTGVCKRDSCGSHHKCVEKKYKVAVIRQKELSDQELPETRGLPASLQDSWISETISVSIACECIPNM